MIMLSNIITILLIIALRLYIYYFNTTSAVYPRLSVNRDMVKYFEALGLLTNSRYVYALPTHVTASSLSTGLFITRD